LPANLLRAKNSNFNFFPLKLAKKKKRTEEKQFIIDAHICIHNEQKIKQKIRRQNVQTDLANFPHVSLMLVAEKHFNLNALAKKQQLMMKTEKPEMTRRAGKMADPTGNCFRLLFATSMRPKGVFALPRRAKPKPKTSTSS